MRAVLTNFGSIGDFRPLLILARELAAGGHTPIMAFPPFAESLVAGMGFEFCPLGPDLLSQRDKVNAAWAESPAIHDSFERMFSLLLPFRDGFDQIYAELRQVCRGADVLISGPVQPMARMVHEKTGIPFVSLQVAQFGGHGGPVMRRIGDELINPFRRKLGLPSLRDSLTIGANSPQLALYAISSHLFPRPADWPRHYRLTGFFFDARPDAWEPEPELQRFLAEGDPPVAITLGSMVHGDSRAIAELLVEAVTLAGCRAIVQGMPVESIPPRCGSGVLWTGYLSHDWLFPRAACIVLHGGAGTSAAVFKSGIPGVFVPHGDCYDQRYWAQLAREAGCSVPAIEYSNLTARVLASAIAETMKNGGLRAAAAALGEKVRKDSGARLAAGLIGELVASVGLCQD